MGGWVSEWSGEARIPFCFILNFDQLVLITYSPAASSLVQAAGHKPDIISISSVLGALNRAREEDHGNLKENNAARLDSEIDAVFENCLAQRPPAVFGPPCLDTMYEIDLTSLPIAVARAAMRWALRRILHDQGVLSTPVAAPVDDSDWYGDYGAEEAGGGVQDLTFIVGVGVAHTSRDARRKALARLNSEQQADGAAASAAERTLSLREYALEVLRGEFGLPADVPGQFPGTIVVAKGDLDAWVKRQKRE